MRRSGQNRYQADHAGVQISTKVWATRSRSRSSVSSGSGYHGQQIRSQSLHRGVAAHIFGLGPVCLVRPCSTQLLANLRRMPIDRAGELIETLLKAIEPSSEYLHRARNVFELGGLWEPGAFRDQ